MQCKFRYKRISVMNAVNSNWTALNFKNIYGKEMLEIFLII